MAFRSSVLGPSQGLCEPEEPFQRTKKSRQIRPADFWVAPVLEAAGGFEPPYNGFADRRLTTWLSRLFMDDDCKTAVDTMSR